MASVLLTLAAQGCGEHDAASSPADPVSPPVGLAALTDLASLTELRPPGYRAEQTSSYDRSGGNADLGVGPDTVDLLQLLGVPGVELDHSYLYRDGDRYVIFDSFGPGVVYRIWMTGLDALFRGGFGGDIAFELDNEATPRLALSREDLFSGTSAPFLSPLAGNANVSSGGFYSMVPIPFAQRLRITTSNAPNWVHISAARLPIDMAIDSFDPSANTIEAASTLANAGEDPKGIQPTHQDTVAIELAAGMETMWEAAGPGTILRLELYAPTGSEIPVGLRLQGFWDDSPAAQLDTPLDDFFGAALGPGARSLAFGQDGDRYYCYFAMPFHRRARLVLRNDGDDAVTGWRLEVARVNHLTATRPLYFHASARSARLAAGASDYVILDVAGTGHVVGVVLTAGCAESGRCQLAQLPGLDGSHLEGDERIAVDGSRYPQIHGTGLEDFFNGGFYFIRGPFTLPTHGNPAQVPTTSARRPGLNLRSTYRLLVGDAIPFYQHIRLAIEHGPTNDAPADMSSVAFYYARPEPALLESDMVTIGSAESEAAHRLEADHRIDRTLRAAFRGDESDQLFERSGMESTRTRLRVRLNAANRGIRLRRLADIGAGAQAAVVSVDGRAVGTWHSADINSILRWAELDFDIPATFTGGREAVDIEIDARASPTPWTAYGYSVLSYRD